MTRYLVRFDNGAASIVEAERIVSFEERAAQYLAAGAIDIVFADGEHVAALCEGYSKSYRLGFEPERGWWCSCRIPGECPHLLALRTVAGTVRDSPRRAEMEREANRARARHRAEFDQDPEIVAIRTEAERVPKLEAEIADLGRRAERAAVLESRLRSQAHRLAELEAQTAQKLSEQRLELMRRDVKLNQLHMELRRLRARRTPVERLAAR